MPEEKRSNWSQIFELLRDEVHAYMSDLISYILYLELNQYSSEAWGMGCSYLACGRTVNFSKKRMLSADALC